MYRTARAALHAFIVGIVRRPTPLARPQRGFRAAPFFGFTPFIVRRAMRRVHPTEVRLVKSYRVRASLTLGLLLLCCAPLAIQVARAQTPTDAQKKRDLEIEERFKAADKNHDGRLTLEEAKAGMPRVAKNFDRIDADKKGYVTLDQIKAMAAK